MCFAVMIEEQPRRWSLGFGWWVGWLAAMGDID